MSAAAASAVDPAAEPSPEARPSLSRRLRREHLEAPSPTIARSLLGRLLVHESVEGMTIGRIVETEAYDGPHDRASHSRAGRTPRTEVMFGAPGFAYVYLVYGMHHCLNVVCGPDGTASAILIRALEPVDGLALMRRRRGATAGPDERLSAGPARLTQAMGIDRRHGGSDLVDGSTLYLADPSPPIDDLPVLVGPRIGVDYAGPEWAGRPWRFGVSGSPSLSRPFPDHR